MSPHAWTARAAAVSPMSACSGTASAGEATSSAIPKWEKGSATRRAQAGRRASAPGATASMRMAPRRHRRRRESRSCNRLRPAVAALAHEAAVDHQVRRIVSGIGVGVESGVGLQVLQPVLDLVLEAPAGVVRVLLGLDQQLAGAVDVAGFELVVGEEGDEGLPVV